MTDTVLMALHSHYCLCLFSPVAPTVLLREVSFMLKDEGRNEMDEGVLVAVKTAEESHGKERGWSPGPEELRGLVFQLLCTIAFFR